MAQKSSAKKMAVKTGMLNRKHQRSRKEESEFGLGQKEFLKCSDCGVVYFDKSWHRSLLEEKLEHLKEKKQFKFTLCPTCKMKKNKVFEGQLTIRLTTNNQRFKEEILNTVKNSDKQGQEWDPLDRILWMEDGVNEVKVYTSENQLAVKIGKKLKSSFPGSTLEIKHSGEDIIRVYWKY